MTHSLWTIILAAGQGSRLAPATGGTRKQFLHHEGHPLYWRSVLTMSAIPELAGVVLVFPAQELDRRSAELETLKDIADPGVRILTVCGGDRRQDSVRMGLAALPRDCDRVLVHDSARPFFTPALVRSLLERLTDEVGGVVPAIPVTDTIKQI